MPLGTDAGVRALIAEYANAIFIARLLVDTPILFHFLHTDKHQLDH